MTPEKISNGRERDRGIELLRCVLMLCIVFWHCSMCFPEGDVRIAKLLACLPVFAVDSFVLISGWYGVSFSWQKVLRLLGLGLYSAVFVCGIILLVEGRFSFRYSLGWFGLAYLALLFFSPLVNAGLDVLSGNGLLVRFWGVYSILTFVSWLPIQHFGIDVSVPGFGGMTFNTMLYVYVTGRVLRTSNWTLSNRRFALIVLFGLLMLANVALAIGSGITRNAGAVNLLFSAWRVNDSPLVIAMAVVFFLLFIRGHFPSCLERFAAFLAPSMFSVYLLHCGTNFEAIKHMISRHVACGSVMSQLYMTVVVACAMFVLAVLADLMRRFALQIYRNTKGVA